MHLRLTLASIALLGFTLTLPAQQSGQNQQTAPAANAPQQRSPGGDVGSGTGDIGKGTAKGAGAAAEGVGKGAGDLVTLHPVGAADNLGKGAVDTGKDVGVGVGKGTGKIAKGTGRGIGRLFHHHHDHSQTPDSSEPPSGN